MQLKELLETPGGGDWERKNRLKVYEGVFAMATRDFRKAATLFLDSLSTFTATELCSYNQFVFYTVVTAMVALDRVSLKKRVVDTPEILAVLGQLPNMESFLNGLYNCKYKARASRGLPSMRGSDLLQCPPGIHGCLPRRSRPSARRHAFAQALPLLPAGGTGDCICAGTFRLPRQRALSVLQLTRLRPRTQFLESYKSVTIQMMASAFGVSAAFLDGELSEFIAAGRLNCKIDKARDTRTGRPA